MPEDVDEVVFEVKFVPWKVIRVPDVAAGAALPQTGDSSSLALWFAVMAGVMAVGIVRNKKAA